MSLRATIDKVLSVFMVILMAVLVLDVLWQIASRYLNRLLISWMNIQLPTKVYAFTDELAGFLLIWVALAGAAYVTGKKQHLAIDLLSAKLSQTGKRFVGRIINTLILLFAVLVMIIGGTWLVYTRFILGQVSAALEIPIGYVYLIVPVSGILISYYAIYDFIRGENPDQPQT